MHSPITRTELSLQTLRPHSTAWLQHRQRKGIKSRQCAVRAALQDQEQKASYLSDVIAFEVHCNFDVAASAAHVLQQV